MAIAAMGNVDGVLIDDRLHTSSFFRILQQNHHIQADKNQLLFNFTLHHSWVAEDGCNKEPGFETLKSATSILHFQSCTGTTRTRKIAKLNLRISDRNIPDEQSKLDGLAENGCCLFHRCESDTYEEDH